MKLCKTCGKPGKFYKNPRSKDGLRYQCSDCLNKKCKEYRISPNGQKVQRGEKRLKRNREYMKHKYHSDPQYRNRKKICSAISKGIVRCIGSKGKNRRKWETIVGYSYDDIKLHLELLFLPQMTWDNHGEWHIDHIRPISSFSFSSSEDEEFKQCWALSNLQPLWAKDNLSKGNKFNPTNMHKYHAVPEEFDTLLPSTIPPVEASSLS